MSDNLLITEETANDLSDLFSRFNTTAPFSQTEGYEGVDRDAPNIHGYLMQPLSQGKSALVACTTRSRRYRSFKIDLAGIIWKYELENPNTPIKSQFQLQFKKDGAVWFTTPAINIRDLMIINLISIISTASNDPSGNPQIPLHTMTGALGHPAVSSRLSQNDDLVPSIDPGYKQSDLLMSYIGSWLFSIDRKVLPDDFDVNLLFTVTGGTTVQLQGPAVMTLVEVEDVFNGQLTTVTDILNIARPTPLPGGSKIAAIPFVDCGYGVIAGMSREYFFEQQPPT